MKNNMVYVCSPYRGSTEQIRRNKAYARKLTRAAVMNGFVPVTVHLYLTEVLDDRNARERDIGLEAGKEILQQCKYILCGTKYGISEGMAAEIKLAKEQSMIVIYEEKGKIYLAESKEELKAWEN